MLPQYAGVGQTCPGWQVQVSNGGSLSTSGTLYFSFQLQNRAGFNRPSVSNAVTYTAGQKITITIPNIVQQPGWDIHYYVLSAGTTNDPSTHVQIARVPGFQFGPGIDPQSVKTNLPATITLTQDAHIALAPTVATNANLPTGTARLDGCARWVTSEAKWFEYRADSALPLSPDVVPADVGRWVRIASPTTYVADTRGGMGSDRPITEVNPITTIPTPPYPGQAPSGKVLPSWEAQYWLYNDDTVALKAGTEFGIELEYNNRKSPDLLNGLFMVKFIGYVQADGTIRTRDSHGTAFPTAGGYFPWTPRLTAPFVTPDDLQPQEAIALAVKPYFSVAELNNQISPGSTIGVIPSIRTQSGDYNPLGKLLANGAVFDLGDRYRVVPNFGLSFDILSGSALVGGYDFPLKPRRTIGGLVPNTPGQKIVINGNGAVYVDPPSYTPTPAEAIRAIVSTASGESATGAWSGYQAILSGQGATLTLSYPCDGNGKGTVRADYPDVLAGNSKGNFNPLSVNIYLQRQDNAQIWRFTGFTVVAAPTQQFTITDWSQGTVVAALPTTATNFSLFLPGAATIASAGNGTFPATSYRVAYSFVYDGNQITSISHASPPCILEWKGDFQPPTITVGTVTTLPPGSQATVTNSGKSNAAVLNFALPAGVQGATGPAGAQGPTGAQGPAGTIQVGTVTTLAAGSQATITNSGTSTAAVLNFRLPTGSAGATGRRPAGTIQVGTVTTLAAGSQATITNSGTSTAAVLNFGLPTGPAGAAGAQGPAGPAGSVNSSTGALILDNASTPPGTSATQIAIWNNGGSLQVQSASSGESREVGDRTVPAKLFLLSLLS